MIDRSLTSLENASEDTKNVKYRPSNREFGNKITGRPIPRELLSRGAADSYAMGRGTISKGNAGWRTIARYALFAQLRAAQEGEVLRDGSRLLDALRQISSGTGRGEGSEGTGTTQIRRAENITEQIQVKNLEAPDSWLLDLSDPSLKPWLDELDQRDKRVGVLLRDMHYLHSSEPPKKAKFYETEADYWTHCARSAPGLDEEKVRKELERRRSSKADQTS